MVKFYVLSLTSFNGTTLLTFLLLTISNFTNKEFPLAAVSR